MASPQLRDFINDIIRRLGMGPDLVKLVEELSEGGVLFPPNYYSPMGGEVDPVTEGVDDERILALLGAENKASSILSFLCICQLCKAGKLTDDIAMKLILCVCEYYTNYSIH